MYEIIFYEDKNGRSEIQDYLEKLTKKNDKDSRIKFNKIVSYIDLLSKKGIEIGKPYIKHINNNIWELRPVRDRILFAYFDNNKFILLSIFMKQTQKTPKSEIEKAIRNLENFKKRRNIKNGK